MGTSLEFDDRIVQAYNAAGRFTTVIGLLEKRVAHDTLDPQARFALAGAHLSAGNRAKAVSVLAQTAKDIPSQKDQADYYIREIQAGRNP